MKALLLLVLGAMLFASAVPTADALSPLFEKTRHVVAKQRAHIKRLQARIFATMGLATTCRLPSCQTSEIDETDHIVEPIDINKTEVAQKLVIVEPIDINKTEVAQKLVHTLPILLGKFLSNEEENRLVYYAYDGEARIGWLTGEYGDDKTIVPYTPDNIKDIDDRSINKELRDLADSLPIASNLDVVHNSAVAGELLSSSYPRYGVKFNAKDGLMLSGIVFARLLALGKKSLWHADEINIRTYVILVTHLDGQELEANDRYFTIIPSDLTDKYGTPPLIPLDDVATRDSISRIRSPMYFHKVYALEGDTPERDTPEKLLNEIAASKDYEGATEITRLSSVAGYSERHPIKKVVLYSTIITESELFTTLVRP